MKTIFQSGSDLHYREGFDTRGSHFYRQRDSVQAVAYLRDGSGVAAMEVKGGVRLPRSLYKQSHCRILQHPGIRFLCIYLSHRRQRKRRNAIEMLACQA